MRTYSLITLITLIAAGLLAGVPAAQAGAATQKPTLIVRDVRAVLLKAGFKALGRMSKKSMPARYIRSIAKMTLWRRQNCALEAELGYDPLKDFISSSISHLHPKLTAGSTWTWRSPTALVQLTYFGARACTGAEDSANPYAQILVVQYSSVQ